MIKIENLTKTFNTSGGDVNALNDINLTINDGDIYGIIGMSGAGKSTLVRCINLLERPTEGRVIINGEDITSLNSAQLRRMRRKVTMIFQSFNLLMQRTCLKNICFPLELAGVSKTAAKKRALELLDIVGLPDKANSYPAQLSGGQMQRIAIARALATDPEVLLCDEATSALDPKTTRSILSLIKDINKRLGITVIVITHQMSVVEDICNKVAILDNGQVVEEGPVTEVFSNPKSEAAKRLVYPEGAEALLPDLTDQRKFRVVYNGAIAANSPAITNMAIDLGITANILGASTKAIGEKAFGSILLSIPADADFSKVKEYLTSQENILVEEV